MQGADLILPGRCRVMGIVNVTEDSFSDGGKFLAFDDAIAHAHELVAQGADIIDVGAESTRPGATRVPPEVEAERAATVIRELHSAGIATSVDTMRAATAAACVEAGVDLINDVSGGLADPDMFRVMADSDALVCLMHWRTVAGADFAEASGRADHGGDVVADVKKVLGELAAAAIDAGVRADNITVDPGLGFAKSHEDNWALLGALGEFIDGDYPVLVGASRKRFLTGVRADRGLPASPTLADAATLAVSALSARLGAWAVRVHDVAGSRDAVDVAEAWRAAEEARRG
ncbi:dihydropteroate synthase [Corynebacterium uterequi]|uniref:Dihydropteroate synthase n=1 Tax=Corynebacterium uterequi TaxID=1072256 RepID=A0A0G3HEU5_9CORY|nr:dihydropteroate synthase [Corynebacterium uterequi]AKK11876.1 dihydropteroate synthase [Corynebacterium uterequi]